MISIPCSVLKSFRSLVRKAGLHKRFAGATPGVSLIANAGGCLIRSASHEAAIQHRHAGSFPTEEYHLPLEALDAHDGKGNDLVTLESVGNGRTSLNWTDRGVERQKFFEPVKLVPFPVVPTSFVPNEPVLWSALHDALPVTDRESSRYALGCLHLRGRLGRVDATDGRHVLTQGGFQFGWTDDVLLPANGVLGCRALDRGEPIAVGRTGDWVGFGLGNWLVMVAIQKEGRYPKIDEILPKPEAAKSRLEMSEADAEFLVDVLPRLPSDDPHHGPVTCDLNGRVLVRTREAENARPAQVELSGSRLIGEPVVLHSNRSYVAQALRLGFRALHCFGPESPVLCADERRKFLWCLLDSKSAIPRHDDPVRITPQVDGHRTARRIKSAATKVHPIPSSEAPMTVPINHPAAPSAAAAANDTKPIKRVRMRPAASTIEQAVALRDSLRNAARQAGELARWLKHQKRQARIVETTLASLKQLQKAAA